MFYMIDKGTVHEIRIEEIVPNISVFGYLDKEEFEADASALGFKTNRLEGWLGESTHMHTAIEVYDDYSVAAINIVTLNDIRYQRDRVFIVVKRNLFLVVKIEDDDDSTMDALRAAAERFSQNATLEKIIFGTLDILLAGGSGQLERYEQRIMEMERQVVSGKTDERLNRDIYEMRNRLSLLKRYYEQLVDIGEELEENENEIFYEKELRYIKIFTDKAQRLSNNTQALSESLIHLREALDAALNYSMNRIMKVFTVVSVIFLPLTLITGWYGMNFTHMPELSWRLGYPGVALLCVLVLILCLIYFKKKKWL